MSTRSIYEVVEDQDAEVKKQQFLRLVEQLSLLRDLQYEKHDAEETQICFALPPFSLIASTVFPPAMAASRGRIG
jgi:hypothetical protein